MFVPLPPPSLFLSLCQEIFDEITEEDITFAWNFDFRQVQSVYASSRRVAEKIAELEAKILEVRVCVHVGE